MFEWFSTGLIIVLLVFVVAFCNKQCQFYTKYCKFPHWSGKGVHQVRPEVFFGNVKQLLIGKKSLADTYLDFYNEFKRKGLLHGGIHFFAQPQYMPINLEIVKNILHDDFSHFTSHGFYQHEKDPITRNLFRLEGDEWKQLRSKLTRAFSTVKIKEMCRTMSDICQKLDGVLDKQVEQNKGLLKIEELATGFTIDVTVACIFGIESNSLKDPKNCAFRQAHRSFLTPNLTQPWLEYFIPSNILYNLSYRTFSEIGTFLGVIVDQLLEYRSSNNIFSKDLIHHLMELRDKKLANTVFTREDIIAQAFVFFTAGYETSAGTVTFAMYELAKYQEIQQNLRQEILETVEKYNGDISYEAVMEMKYLDMVVHETLRMHPPISTLPRKCTENYLVPGTNLIIEKGTIAQISVLGIHMDPEYYPDPEVFDPLRFCEENKAKRPKCSWIPFGSGPRMCLGTVFGMLQTKLGIIGLLNNHEYTLESPKTPLKMLPGLFTSHSSDDIVLNVARTKHCICKHN